MEIFQTRRPWNGQLPGTLVLACSDGRLQKEVDEFLHGHLAISHYDRLYVPGGAGALATSGGEFLRADRFRRECRFLIKAHEVNRVILMFHGPTEDGPPEAVCGDYRRRQPMSSPTAIRRQQERDAEQIWRDGLIDKVPLEIYRCEVASDGLVRFVQLRA
jgi:hypothetical protein